MAAHYKLNGDLTDSSGNGVDGTAMGGDPLYAAGILGDALDLDGVDDFVDFALPTVWPIGRSPRSMCAWAKTDSVAGGWRWIAAYGASGTGQAMFIGMNGDDLFGGGYGDDIRSNDFWEVDVWHHICLTYDGTTARLYADGRQMVAQAKNWDLLMMRAHIGRQVNNAAEFWDGLVDDLRIYDYALSPAQVAGLAGRAAENPITDTWSDWGLVDVSLESNKAMRLDTYGVPGLAYYVGEASRATPFADLTAGGGKALDVWFSGDPANTASAMYMSLADGDGASDTLLYSGDLATADWQVWHVDMRDFEGVDKANASEIAIGLAGLDGGALGDIMLIDDLRVYAGRCIPDLAKPTYDFNLDCMVSIPDLQMLASYWDYPAAGEPGLWYEYYETWIFGNDIQNAPFDTTIPTRTGTINNFDISDNRGDRFGFRFTGMITVPEDGDYTFYTSSDDGSFLDIGDTRVVENYGWHGMQWREGTITLTAGAHPITVAMFEDGGGEGLEVEYAGPGIDRQAIPDDVLSIGAVPSRVDLYEDGAVDWFDVFVMLDEWLDEQLWPY
jgi:hypothetical protein